MPIAAWCAGMLIEYAFDHAMGSFEYETINQEGHYGKSIQATAAIPNHIHI